MTPGWAVAVIVATLGVFTLVALVRSNRRRLP